MQDPEIARRFEAALQIARAAARLAHDHWIRRDTLEVEAKASRQDIVSEADRAVETLIRAAIAADFPEDAILGEEFGATGGTSGFTWILDPIDGTSPYLFGLPSWCCVIAVTQGTETVIGVIDVPTQGEVFAAIRGGGATLNGRDLAIPVELTLANAATGIGASHRTDPAQIASWIEALLDQGGMFFRNGSGALMLASVAAGRLAGYVEPHMNAWDCLAGLLTIREAGGRTGDFCADGDYSKGGAVIAAAPGAWDALAAISKLER